MAVATNETSMTRKKGQRVRQRPRPRAVLMLLLGICGSIILGQIVGVQLLRILFLY